VTTTTRTPAPAPAIAAGTGTTPRFIGLDLSLTSTGIAAPGWSDAIRPGTLRGHPRLHHLLTGIADHTRHATHVAVEGPSLGDGVKHRNEELAWLRGLVAHDLWKRGIAVAVIPPVSRIVYMTGTGQPKDDDGQRLTGTRLKGAVRTAVADRYGIRLEGPTRYDEADAYAVLAMFLDQLGMPLTPVEDKFRRALDGCAWPELGVAA
jgi:hypothetical protein